MRIRILLILIFFHSVTNSLNSQSFIDGFSFASKYGFNQPDGGVASGLEVNIFSKKMVFSLNGYGAREFQKLGSSPMKRI